jgi:hypothetical protein
MLKRVRLDWIDGVLNQSLYKEARIALGLETKVDAVELPLNAIVQVPDRSPTAVPPGTAIAEVFDSNGGALLILGAPGTATLLLELAEDLLDRADRDESHPIPVVFNLSSWAVRRQPLARWLAAELNERSDVPKALAQRWVESEEVLPLLDGLDEVAIEYRQACAEVINDFRRDHGLLPVAVCSRTVDYQALGMKLRLRSAVVVQPLTGSQVDDYLGRRAELSPLYAATRKDTSLAGLLETPLMLWVAMLAYREAPLETVKEESREMTRKRLFTSFVDAMFKRRSIEVRYTQADTLSWLSWLASALAFDDVSERTGVKRASFYLSGWGTKLFDFDNDGWKDLFVANGHVMRGIAGTVRTLSYAEPLLMLKNQKGRFVDVSAQMGTAFGQNWAARGAAFGDFDNDGDIDILVQVLGGPPLLLENQQGNRNHWLGLELIGTKSNRDAIGAVIKVVDRSGAERSSTLWLAEAPATFPAAILGSWSGWETKGRQASRLNGRRARSSGLSDRP